VEETPEREASAKLAQHLAVAVQVAEAVIRLRQQRVETQAAASQQAAGAARAERIAQHAADRVVYSRAFDRDWTSTASVADLGRVWGAATGWADTDPTADVAASRAETRLAEMAPAAMDRYQHMRDSGVDRAQAMRDVLARVATESRPPRVFVAGAGPSAAQANADTAAHEARRAEHIPDDPATPRVDEHADGMLAAVPRRAEQHTWQAAADATSADRCATWRATGGYPHPVDVAAASYPHPYAHITATAAGKPSPAATATAARTKARALTR
jgi:hypothetical protein